MVLEMIRKAAAYILLVSVYGLTWLVAVLGQAVPRRPWKPTGRIMVTGTIFNPNWYLSHITPLTRSGVKEVILVIDEPQQPLEGVRFACPPKWLARIISRAGAKAIWVLYTGIRYRPDLFMGYNLVAGGCTALMAGAILGRPACYQMTGGQRVLSTSEWDRFDAGDPSRFRQLISLFSERLAIEVIRNFALVVVRGNRGKEFLSSRAIKHTVEIISGSIPNTKQHDGKDRDIDLIFVGRLHRVKQVGQFIDIVDRIRLSMWSVKAVIVGDGKLREKLENYASSLEVQNHIDFVGKRKDVEAYLSRSKLFVLTSISEGLSIAMMEAMIYGAVPVVADVGELGDLVSNGVNGYLIEPNNIAMYVSRMLFLLKNEDIRHRYSQRAVETIRTSSTVDIIAEKWRRCIQQVVSQFSHSDGEK